MTALESVQTPSTAVAVRESAGVPAWTSVWWVKGAATSVLMIFMVAAHHNATAMVLLVGYLLLVPGDLLRRLLRVEVPELADRAVLAVAGSLVVLLLVGTVVQVVGELAGMDHPLARGSLLAGMGLANLALFALQPPAADAGPTLLPRPRQEWAVVAVLAALTVAAVAGVHLLDNRAGPAVILLVLALTSLAALAAGGITRPIAAFARPWAIFTFALVIGWSFSLRTRFLYGYDIQQELAVFRHTLKAGLWEPVPGDPYSAMLSLTLLPTSLVELTGIPHLYVFKFLYPMVFALYPVIVFRVAQRRAGARVSALVALLTAFIPSSLWQLPAIARQEIGLLLFGALLLTLLVATGPRRGVTVLACLLGVAMVVSHYSTAYVGSALIIGAVLLSAMLQRLRPGAFVGRSALPVVVAVVLLISTAVWNVQITQSTSNLNETANAVATQGLGLKEAKGSFFQAWLAGTTVQRVPAREFFEETAEFAKTRPWIQEYDSNIHQQFRAVDATVPESPGAVPLLRPVLDIVYLVLRQLTNALSFLVVLILGIHTLAARPGRVSVADVNIVILCAVMVLLLVLLRSSSSLALAYNPERLALQAAPILGIALAWSVQDASSFLRYVPVRRWAAGAVAVLGLLDATGLRFVVAGGDVGNLRVEGEHYERYARSDADVAAAEWLGRHRDPTNMVFADRYGALILRTESDSADGIIDLLTPATLDQRAYVFASAGNLSWGRMRGVLNSKISIYEYPVEFLDRYKSLVYSNGLAEVFK